MKPANMLHQMCHVLLAGTDVKAMRKARGLPPQAESSPGILETLLLSPQGLSDVFNSLELNEVAVLHLLKDSGGAVDVSFFGRIYGGNHAYGGTFNQRFQDCFAEVKKRLIRRGILLWGEVNQASWEKASKLERSRFALPAEFHSHLPPLIPSPRQFEGDGDWRPTVARDKLMADLGGKAAKNEAFQIAADELRFSGKRFEAAALSAWQQSQWSQAVRGGKKSAAKKSGSKKPDEAVLCALSELADGCWAGAEQLAEVLQVFCGKKIDGDSVCEAGWEWGLLAKRQADSKTWYRLAPEQPPLAPDQYLTSHDADGHVAADLKTIPLDVLQQVIEVSDQRLSANGKSKLLLTPNFVKLGRAKQELLEAESIQWLIEHTQPFAEAYVHLGERRGKTNLHENVAIARVGDLSLKVALEKALGSNLVSLKNDFVAFPRGLLDDVQRVVKKSGHVVKEVAAK